MNTAAKPLLDINKTAAFLGMPPTRLTGTGKRQRLGIPHLKIGRSVRFSEDDLLRWLADRSSEKREADRCENH
jgi:hypothetical protein